MIVIDVPMPETCEDCPCSYYIRTGEYEGLMMCNAMEFKAQKSGFREELSKHFVVAEDCRPDNCPIKMEVVSNVQI
jgi:hypothetical protein